MSVMTHADPPRAVLVSLVSIGAFRNILLLFMCVLAALVLLTPAHPRIGASGWNELFDLARSIPDVRQLASQSRFPLAAALSYACALTASPLIACVGLFARMHLVAFEAIQRSWPVRYRAFVVLLLIVFMVPPFFSDALTSSSVSTGFFARVAQSRVLLLLFLAGLSGFLVTAYFWILLELVTFTRKVRSCV